MDNINWQEQAPKFQNLLKSIYSEREATLIFDILETFIQSKIEKLDAAFWKKLEQDIRNHRPIQYIVGRAYFSDFELFVAEGVLIPRPETDELVFWIQNMANQLAQKLNIWDIGTGSACIALALKKHLPQASVWASDISEAALKIAKQNAQNLCLDIQLFKNDILQEVECLDLPLMDIIVSNPPYILPEEINSIANHVKDFEPHTALFVSNHDPLQFYKAIEKKAKVHLKSNGLLFFELHSKYAQEIIAYFESMEWNTVIKKDMQGKERMLLCKRIF